MQAPSHFRYHNYIVRYQKGFSSLGDLNPYESENDNVPCFLFYPSELKRNNQQYKTSVKTSFSTTMCQRKYADKAYNNDN